jgi:predicted ABC-type ATPase
MEGKNMSDQPLQPEIIVFAGPNGSGKSTIKKNAKTVGIYINADDIKRTTHCSDKEAANQADKLREEALCNNEDFTFETVLSTKLKLDFLRRAKTKGYFIRAFFILTLDPEVNILRVKVRVAEGGHDVPEDKIRSRYKKSLGLLPELIKVCDVLHVYDNTTQKPVRIFKKRKTECFVYENELWDIKAIESLTGIKVYSIKQSS